jgi:DNA-binding NarL/FixJ family response regulator
MDSRDSTVQFAIIKHDEEELLEVGPKCADAKLGEETGTIVYRDADECLTFGDDPERSGCFPCTQTSGNGNNRLRDVLLPRDEPIGMAIVDGDAGTRFLLRQILEKSGGYRCVGSYVSSEEALREIPRVNPRIVLMEVRMPGISGIETMRRLKSRLPGLIVVLVSGLTDADTMSSALAAGGDGYLTKPFAVAQCLATVRFSFQRVCTTPLDRVDSNAISSQGCEELARLTSREHHVMGCLAKGLLYKEIADELRLSFSTVHKLQHRIFLKLHVNNRTEAVTKWRNGNGG